MPSRENHPHEREPSSSPKAFAARGLARSRSSTLLFLLAVLAFCAMSQSYRAAGPAVGIDYYQFWAVGRAIASHQARDIYSEHGRAQLGGKFLAEALRSPAPAHRAVALQRRVFDTTATPFLYTLFGACSTADYAANLRAFRAVLLACFGFSVVGISKLLRQPTPNALVSLALLCLWFEPLASDLRVGNVGCIQLAGLLIYVLLRLKAPVRSRYLLAGTFMGLLVAFKPNLMIVAGLPLVDSLLGRQYKELLSEVSGVALGVGIAIACSAAAIGNVSVWLEWYTALRNVPEAVITSEMGNCSPLMTLGSSLGRFAKPILALALLGAIGVGVWLRNREDEGSDPHEAGPRVHRLLWLVSLGCLGLVLIPHLAWLHYFVLTLPALILILSNRTSATRHSRAAWRNGLTIVAWLGLSINPLTAVGITFSNATYGTVVVVASIALLVATIATFSPPSAAERATPLSKATH